MDLIAGAALIEDSIDSAQVGYGGSGVSIRKATGAVIFFDERGAFEAACPYSPAGPILPSS